MKDDKPMLKPVVAHTVKMTGEKYRQCSLRNTRLLPNLVAEYTAFVPKEFAVIGETLKLKTDEGWQDGWEVIAVGAERDWAEIEGHRHAWKHHADVTDI